MDRLSVDQHPKKSFPLHKVVEYKNPAKTKILLRSTKDINEKNDKGDNVLLIACAEEKNDEILILLLNQKNIDVTVRNNDGFSPLHLLAFKGNFTGVKMLFSYFPEIEVDVETDKKNTPLIMASKMNHANIIKYLCKKGANVNHQNSKHYTAIQYAANNGYLTSTETLIKLGANVNGKDDYGYSPLMKACQWGFTEVCKVLIKNGADVNLIVNDHMTPLSQACFRGEVAVCKLLLENNANPNLVGYGKNSSMRTALSTACFQDNLEIVKLLVSYGADINYPGQYSLGLLTCARNDKYSCADFLLSKGANIRGRDKRGKSAIDIAKQFGNEDCVDLFKDYL